MIRALLAIGLLAAAFSARAESLNFSDAERQQILRHGPWPLDWAPDPSNRVSGKRAAIELGRVLFFEPRLSGTGTIQCSTCHLEIRAWQDGRVTGAALSVVDRNTPSLLDVRSRRWFGWDGANDNLWAQSIRPLFDPREMKASAAHVARLLRSDEELRNRYRQAFGAAPDHFFHAVGGECGQPMALAV